MRFILMPLIALLTVCVSVTSAFAGRTVTMRDKNGVMDALESGDAEAFRKIVAAHDRSPEFGEAARLRVLGDFEGSMAKAKMCVREAKGEMSSDRFALAAASMPCDLLVAGNYLLVGDIAEWAKGILHVKDYLYPVIREKSQVADLGLDVIEGYQYEKLTTWPALSVTASQSGSSDLDVSWMGYNKSGSTERGEPFIKVTVNGKSLDMMVDTGASASIVSAETASKLGLGRVVEDYGRASDSSSGSYVSLGEAQEMSIGPITLHHLPILIGSTPKPVLGLNALMRLGAFRLTNKSLRVIAADDTQDAECRTPLLISSSIIGTHAGVVVPLTVNNQNCTALLDTGDNAYVRGIREEPPNSNTKLRTTKAITASGEHEEQVFDERAAFAFGPVRKDLTFETAIDTSHYYRQPFVLGAAALQDVSLLLDFRTHRVCLDRSAR